jgi:hypothetical protein
MPDPAMEREHLSAAERHIVEGEERITMQMLLVDRLRKEGHDVMEAERLLLTLRETLVAWNGHRDQILQELARHNEIRSR